MFWQQLKIQTGEQHAGYVGELLFAQSAVAVSMENAEDLPASDHFSETVSYWEEVWVVGMFEEGVDLQSVLDAIQRVLDKHVIHAYHVEYLPDQKWELAWRKYFHPMRFGKSLWVCPTGEAPGDPAGICVALEPGMGFGTGTHPSTGLCLEWLDENPPTNQRVIDYGCGSGILSIAALKLGATQAWAIDIDPDALDATQGNLERNQLSNTQVMTALPENKVFKEAVLKNPVDLLIANITAYPLIDLAAEFATYVKPGGRIVLSGILSEQSDRMQKAYGVNFSFASEKILNGWTRLEFVRR